MTSLVTDFNTGWIILSLLSIDSCQYATDNNFTNTLNW
jgi:hypothetical protein